MRIVEIDDLGALVDELRRLRRARGLKQEDIARAVDRAQGVVSSWETTKSPIGADRLLLYLNAVGAKLCVAEPEPTPPLSSARAMLSQLAERLSEEDLAALVLIAERLAERGEQERGS